MKSRLLLVMVILLCAAGMLFAGGGAEEAEPEQAPAQEEAEVRERIVVAMGAEPEALDPIAMASAPSATVSEHVLQPLVYMSAEGVIEPQLATEWAVSEDNLSWTFTLREDVVFHDGTAFNAEAVQTNIERFLDPENAAPFAFLLSGIDNVEVTGEYEVTFNLTEPFAPILSNLSNSFIAMVSPAQLAEATAGEPITDPIGTGPYRFVEWNRGENIILAVNEDYYGNVPAIPEIEWRFITEDSARVVALESGEADVIMRVPPADAPRLEGSEDFALARPSSVRTIYLGFHTQREPFTDQRVRQALNHAVNKEAIVNSILQGVGSPSSAPVSPGVFGYTPVGPYEYDPERARELLADAGYEDGFEITLYHPTGRYLLDATVVEAVQAQLAEVGVTANLQTLEWSSYLAAVRVPPEEAPFDMYMLGWGTVTLDADYGLYALMHSSQISPAGWNTSFFSNDEIDALLDTGRTSPAREARAEAYEAAIEAIWDQAPWLYLHNEGQLNAYSTNVEGIIHHPLENVFLWDAEFAGE
jgi:peptide/nickel transport system substrate-binding protein